MVQRVSHFELCQQALLLYLAFLSWSIFFSQSEKIQTQSGMRACSGSILKFNWTSRPAISLQILKYFSSPCSSELLTLLMWSMTIFSPSTMKILAHKYLIKGSQKNCCLSFWLFSLKTWARWFLGSSVGIAFRREQGKSRVTIFTMLSRLNKVSGTFKSLIMKVRTF